MSSDDYQDSGLFHLGIFQPYGVLGQSNLVKLLAAACLSLAMQSAYIMMVKWTSIPLNQFLKNSTTYHPGYRAV